MTTAINETTTAASTTVAWSPEELSALNGATKSQIRLATARKLNAHKGSGIGGDVAQQVGAPFSMKGATVRENVYFLKYITQFDKVMPGLLARLDAGEFDLMPTVAKKAADALDTSVETALVIIRKAIAEGLTSHETQPTESTERASESANVTEKQEENSMIGTTMANTTPVDTISVDTSHTTTTVGTAASSGEPATVQLSNTLVEATSPTTTTPVPMAADTSLKDTSLQHYEMVDPNDLSEHPRTPQLHIRMELVVSMTNDMSLNGFDPAFPIKVWLINGKIYIVDGRTRRLSAVNAKIAKVPVVYETFESEDDFVEAALQAQTRRRQTSYGDAMVVIENRWPILAARALERKQHRSSTSREVKLPLNHNVGQVEDIIAKELNMCGATVSRLKKIIDYSKAHGTSHRADLAAAEIPNVTKVYDEVMELEWKANPNAKSKAAKASGDKTTTKVERQHVDCDEDNDLSDADIDNEDLSDDPPPPPVVNAAPPTKGASAAKSAPANAPAVKNDATKTIPDVKSATTGGERSQCAKCVTLEMFIIRIFDEIADRDTLARILNSTDNDWERNLVQKQLDQLG